jgi:hypothetical protein
MSDRILTAWVLELGAARRVVADELDRWDP